MLYRFDLMVKAKKKTKNPGALSINRVSSFKPRQDNLIPYDNMTNRAIYTLATLSYTSIALTHLHSPSQAADACLTMSGSKSLFVIYLREQKNLKKLPNQSTTSYL